MQFSPWLRKARSDVRHPEAFKRYPKLSKSAAARALGINVRSLLQWIAGRVPVAGHVELLHDFIEGRVVPVEVAKHTWEFRRAPDASLVLRQVQDALELLAMVASGAATITQGSGSVTIRRVKSPDELDAGNTEDEYTAMAHPDERTHPISYRMYPSDRALAQRLAAYLSDKLGQKVSEGEVLRRGLYRLAKEVMPTEG